MNRSIAWDRGYRFVRASNIVSTPTVFPPCSTVPHQSVLAIVSPTMIASPSLRFSRVCIYVRACACVCLCAAKTQERERNSLAWYTAINPCIYPSILWRNRHLVRLGFIAGSSAGYLSPLGSSSPLPVFSSHSRWFNFAPFPSHPLSFFAASRCRNFRLAASVSVYFWFWGWLDLYFSKRFWYTSSVKEKKKQRETETKFWDF